MLCRGVRQLVSFPHDLGGKSQAGQGLAPLDPRRVSGRHFVRRDFGQQDAGSEIHRARRQGAENRRGGRDGLLRHPTRGPLCADSHQCQWVAAFLSQPCDTSPDTRAHRPAA